MLKLKNVTKDYVTSSETVRALRGVSITFRDKEFVSILGPSGCGKTTLLNIIGGLDKYTSGDLIINERSTKSYKDRDWDVYRNHRVGFIFQSYNLIPHQTVLGNVELALTIAGISKEERTERAKRALDRVGLSEQYYKRPNQLSGGQCQRVAIARALVNDPEILLADEPTGALDTVTSVQIMDLIREIAGERLVIMVTHNPELAEEYSTRIVRLLDGQIIEDTNPVAEEETEASVMQTAPSSGKEKAKMSFLTAFKLSARNLISKKARTSMVGFAGSIGIIGIAMVLAFSAGIKGYVASMQDDMLSGNPITITETTYDLNALTGMMETADKVEILKEPNKVYINSVIEYVAEMSEISETMLIKNNITKSYTDYIRAMPKEYYNAMLFGYGLDTSHSIYVGYEAGFGESKTNEVISIAALTSKYVATLKGTDFAQYASYVTQIAPSFKQAPSNPDYIRSQYDVYGEIADEMDEIMLVITPDSELSDLLLARLGYYSEEEFYNLVYKAAGDERYDPSLDVTYFEYDELLSEEKTITWYPNDAIFTKKTGMMAQASPFGYEPDAANITADGVELKVTGILIANAGTTYGSLSSGIYYTEALTEHMLRENAESEIVKYVEENGDITSMSYGGMPIGVYYTYSYRPFYPEEGMPEVLKEIAFVGKSLGIEDMMGGSMGSAGGTGGAGGSMGGSGSEGGVDFDMSSLKTISARYLGGVDVANNISIYPVSFDDKNLVTSYLDAWNGDGNITVNGEVLSAEGRDNITYTDVLELVINMINTMIDIISYALIAFTSVSLVVSTVMIGIITYISVVERIKEIGVIRSLGGRKRDVSNLFIAETFIIGLLAGLIGVGFTYIASAIVNVILEPLIGYASIAALPIGNAIFLVCLSIGLTLISGLAPASSAAKKDPVIALRTE